MSAFGHRMPLKATGGSVVIAANTANQALTDAAGDGLHGHMTRLKLICRAVGSGAHTLSLLDKSAGNVLWKLDLAAALTVGQVIDVIFDYPHRTQDANGQFFITTTVAGYTWDASCNGFIG